MYEFFFNLLVIKGEKEKKVFSERVGVIKRGNYIYKVSFIRSEKS